MPKLRATIAAAGAGAPLGHAKRTSNLFRDRTEGRKQRLDLGAVLRQPFPARRVRPLPRAEGALRPQRSRARPVRQGEALLAAGADVNAADERGYTALFHGCYNFDDDRGHPDVVEALLAAGAGKEATIGFGVRPLMYAAGNGEAGVVEVLLEAGADPMARNEVGRTALMMVKDRDDVDVINILHEAELQHEAAGCGARNAPDMQVVTFLKRDRNG